MNFDWHRRANAAIAQGSLTNSKRIETFIKGVTPTHVTHGEGAYAYGIDKKKYIDYVCANGTSLFGYAHPLIKDAIKKQLDKGWLYSLGSTMEVECAELVKNHFPFVKKARFLKSGTQATACAIKIARAHTGRDLVLSSGYHGHADDFVSLSPPAAGIPKRAWIQNFTSMDQIKDNVACIIIEPIVTDYSQARLNWLQEVIRKAHVNGALVIFDEVITGFRWPKLSFSKESGIHPDIICLGKACASGLPLSIVGLGDKIGDEQEWFVSSTYAGELLSLAAFKKTCEMLTSNSFSLERLWADGQIFLDEFNAVWPMVQIEGYPTRGVFKGDVKAKALFWQEACKAGILFGPSWFYGFQHIGLREQVIGTCKDILTRIKTGSVSLEGDLPSSPFAERVRSA